MTNSLSCEKCGNCAVTQGYKHCVNCRAPYYYLFPHISPAKVTVGLREERRADLSPSGDIYTVIGDGMKLIGVFGILQKLVDILFSENREQIKKDRTHLKRKEELNTWLSAQGYSPEEEKEVAKWLIHEDDITDRIKAAGFSYEEDINNLKGWFYSEGYNTPKDIELWNKNEAEWKNRIAKEKQMEQYRQLRKEIEAMPQYEHWRQDVFQKFGRKCAVCGSTENLEIDHRYVSFHAIVQKYGIMNTIQAYECSFLWNVENGTPLCKTCHDQTSSSRYRVQKLMS